MERPPPDQLAIETERLVLTLPGPEDAPLLAAFQRENKDAHARFNAPYAAGFFEEAYWRERLATQRRDYLEDRTLCLVLRARPGEGPVLGTCNFTKFVRGRFQACYLGYTTHHAHQGQGLMTEALQGAIPFVFRVLKMHRIMANYVPENERSGRLLARLGFVVEGRAKDYLYVDGAWRDHVLTALTNPEPVAPEV